MAQVHWNNGSGGNWLTGSNWTGNAGNPPGTGDDAIIDANGVYTVTLTSGATVNSLQMATKETLSITSGTLVLTNGSGSGSDAGTIAIGNNTEIDFGGTLNNAGTISLNSAGNFTQLVVTSATASLTGSGTILLDDSGANRIFGASGSDALVNVSNTIAGAGQLGAGQLSFTNQSKGVVDATGTVNALVVNTGGNTIVNAGLLEDTGTAGLVLQSAIKNTGGTILASGAGAHVDLSGADVIGGTLTSASGGIVDVTSTATLDGSTTTVANKGTLQVNNNALLNIVGTINNTGTITLASGGNFTDLQVSGSSAALTGGGKLVLSDNVANRIYGAASSDVLVNVNNTISGAGQISVGQMTNQSAGVVDATGVSALSISVATLSNQGILESTNAPTINAGLVISTSLIDNTGSSNAGKIEAVGAFAHVDLLNGATIRGGTLITGSGGVIQVGNSAILDGSATAAPINNTGLLRVNNNTGLNIEGTINNTGTISLASVGNFTDLIVNVGTVAGSVTLTGGGSLSLSDNGVNRIYGSGGTQTLVNVNNVIAGSGQLGIGNGSLALINQANGVIDATGSAATLTIDTDSHIVTNAGIIEDTGTAGLLINNNTVIDDSTGGVVQAAGAGAAVFLQNATLRGGTVTSSGGGRIEINSGFGQLDGFTSGSIANTGLVQIDNNTTLYLQGIINNTGTISDKSVGNLSDIVVNSGTLTLTGAGHVTLTDNGANRIYGNAAGETLVNVNNVIAGSGQIGVGNGSLVLVNDAAGLIDATGSVATLTIDTDAHVVVNSGIIEDTGTAGLVINNNTVIDDSSGGVVQAVGAGSVVFLQNATLRGGTVTSSGGGRIEINGGFGQLDGATSGSITNSGTVQLDNNLTLQLQGTINNTGTITDNSVGNLSDMQVNSSTVTLTGGGQVVLSNNVQNRIYGTAGGDTLVNVNNTISGAGQIGVNNGTLNVTNQSKGVINANGTASLFLQTSSNNFVNAGLIEVTGSGGLVVNGSTVIDSSSGGTVEAVGAGNNIYLQNATLRGGTVTTTGGADVVINSGFGQLDGATSGSITNSGTVQLDNNLVLDLQGVINNTGVIAGLSGGNLTDIILNSASVTLAGNGTVSLSDSSTNRIYGAAANTLLVNAGNTIAGSGQIGVNNGSLNVDNKAGSLIEATGTGASLIIQLSGNTLTNEGTLAGAGPAGLNISTGTLVNTGLIEALSGSSVTIGAGVIDTNLSGGTLTGGSWEASNTGTTTATLNIFGGPITTDAATIILSGTGSVIETNTGSAPTTLESSLTTIAAGGALQVLGARGYTTSNAITDNGTLLLSGGTFAAASITVGAGGVLRGAGTFAETVVNNGTIAASGGVLTITSSVTGTGVVTVASAASLTEAGSMSAASLTVSSGGTFTAASASITGAISNQGLIEGVGAAGLTLSKGTLTNTGTIEATQGSSLTIQSAVTDTNLVGGTLTGGTWEAANAGAGTATLNIFGGPITTDAATMILSGAGSVIETNTGGTPVTLESSLATIASGGSLQVLGGRNYTTSNAITDNGSVVLGGGTLSAASITIGSTGTLSGSGTVAGSVQQGSGTLSVAGGALTVTGSVTGTAVVSVASATSLSIVGGLIDAGVTVSAGGTLSAGGATIMGAISDSGVITATAGTVSASSITVGAGGTLTAKSVTTTGALSDSGVVTLAGGTLSAATLTLNKGATLGGFGTIAQSVVDSGTLSASGGVLTVNGSVTGSGAVVVGSSASLAVVSSLAAGSATVNAGGTLSATSATVTAAVTDSGAIVLGTGTVTAASLTVNKGGSLSAGGLTSKGSVTDSGTIALGAGTLAAASLTLRTGGALSAASIAVTGTLTDGGSDTLGGGTLTAATLTVSKASTLTGTGTIASAIANSGTVSVAASGILTLTSSITGAGSVVVGTNASMMVAGGISAASATVNTGGVFDTFGTLTGNLTDNGSVTATGGTLSVGGNLSGKGAAIINTSSVLSVAGALSAAGGVTFVSGTGETLALGTPSKATSKISGFGSGDAIDILNQTVTSVTWTQTSTKGGSLVVSGSAGTLGTLSLNGSYAQANFALASDTHGGTDINFSTGALAASVSRDLVSVGGSGGGTLVLSQNPAQPGGGLGHFGSDGGLAALEHALLASLKH